MIELTGDRGFGSLSLQQRVSESPSWSPSQPRGKPGFSTLESSSGRETDSPLEQEGFELPVPLARELLLLAKEKGPEVDLRVVSKGQSLLARA